MTDPPPGARGARRRRSPQDAGNSAEYKVGDGGWSSFFGFTRLLRPSLNYPLASIIEERCPIALNPEGLVEPVPHDCPEGCPPQEANPCAGEYFHLCCSNPVSHTGGTLRTAKEENKFKNSDQCQRCGISVFPSLADCKQLKSILPARISGKWKFVAVAQLNASHGWAKLTGGTLPSHRTWWPSVEAEPQRLSLFVVVSPV